MSKKSPGQVAYEAHCTAVHLTGDGYAWARIDRTSRDRWEHIAQAVLDQGAIAVAPHTSAPLPTWAELTDLDRGAALLHIHKRDYEGREYAIENYPARYFDHPALTALDAVAASDHAAALETTALDLEPGEYERLYDLALDADRKR